jgi:transposase
MEAPPPLSPDVLSALPPAVIALIRWQAAEVERLNARIAELEAKLGKDSTNSSKPPSTEHPHAKPTRSKPRSKRSHGGQPGHPRHERTLVPVEDCVAVIPCVPDTCRGCGAALTGTDPEPIRHQVWELPEIRPVITEYRRHRLICRCGCSTCGVLPTGTPTGQAGPRLIAFSGLLMACFRQSKRRAALFLSTILNQPACPAWMVSLQGRASEAVGPAYEELIAALPNAEALYLDESPSKEGRDRSWVWTFVASTFTVFACRTSRAADVPRQLLGAFAGVIHCDRARMYWAFDKLQYCWAHLKRDFQGLIDSPCGVRRRLGHDLMRPTKEMFGLWEKVRDGTLSRPEFRDRMVEIRRRVEDVLLRGYYDGRVRGFCTDLWEHRARLWVFVDVEGVEPTNNAAERSLRHAVIWRKLSFGTQSAGGSRFVERMLSVIETCRQQKRDVFAWMVNAVHAHLAHRPAPSLLPGA